VTVRQLLVVGDSPQASARGLVVAAIVVALVVRRPCPSGASRSRTVVLCVQAVPWLVTERMFAARKSPLPVANPR
jgi:hypothetical protein